MLITLARKPLGGQTVAESALHYGTGPINIAGCRIGVEPRAYKGSGVSLHRYTDGRAGLTDGRGRDELHSVSGRWPSNVILTGSAKVLGLFPHTGGGNFPAVQNTASWAMVSKGKGLSPSRPMGDSGSAARFYKQIQDEQGNNNAD